MLRTSLLVVCVVTGRTTTRRRVYAHVVVVVENPSRHHLHTQQHQSYINNNIAYFTFIFWAGFYIITTLGKLISFCWVVYLKGVVA